MPRGNERYTVAEGELPCLLKLMLAGREIKSTIGSTNEVIVSSHSMRRGVAEIQMTSVTRSTRLSTKELIV